MRLRAIAGAVAAAAVVAGCASKSYDPVIIRYHGNVIAHDRSGPENFKEELFEPGSEEQTFFETHWQNELHQIEKKNGKAWLKQDEPFIMTNLVIGITNN